MSRLRSAARIAAHLVVLILAAAWSSAAMTSLSSPLFDIGRPRVGNLIIKFCGLLELSPAGIMQVAHVLALFKLVLGLYLFVTVVVAAYHRVRWGETDDALLDVGLFLSAVGSAVAALAFAPGGGEPLVGALGEIILCAMAGLLAAFGAGASWRTDDTIAQEDAALRPA